MGGDVVGVVLFIVIGLCILVPFYLAYLNNVKKMETLIKLAENGVDIKSGTTNLLTQEPGSLSDLRRGVIFIALSLPIMLSLLIGEDYQEAAFFGGIPLCIGLAYLLVVKVGRQSNLTSVAKPQGSEDSF